MTTGQQQFDESLQKSKEQQGSYDDPFAYRPHNSNLREQSQEQWRAFPEANNQRYYQGQEYTYSEVQREQEKLTLRPQRKSRFSTIWIVLTIGLLILFLSGGVFAYRKNSIASYTSFASPMMTQEVYNVGSKPTLTVHSMNMQVSIHADNVSTVDVATTDAGAFKIVQNGDALTINQLAPVDNQRDETIAISVPANTDVNLVTTDASVDVGATFSKLNISTTNGSINVYAATLQDSSTLKSTNGSINFDGVFAPQGHYQIESQNGDITVTTPPDPPIHITASSVNGHVENQLGASNSIKSPLAPDVQLHTVNGTIRVGQE